MTPFAAIDFETAGYDPASACSLGVVAGALGFSFRHHDALEDARACAFIVRKALERSGTDDIEAMMRTQRQKLHTFRVHRTKQDYGLCGELL